MRDSIAAAVFLAIVGSLLLGCVVSGLLVSEAWKHEAVELGHARYFLDEEYLRQWEWLPLDPREVTP